jgi:GTP-binding protein
MSVFQHTTFYTTINHLQDLPTPNGVEIAFAGRSNAGKSSAINALTKRNRLAFVSKTPGRTQHINFFKFGDRNFLVDLPGYGYARVPSKIRQHWEKLLSTYLQTRQPLHGMVLIMDIRHPLTQLDQRMLDWFTPTGKPVHILLTKADKLSRQQSGKVLQNVLDFLGETYPQCSAQLFSSASKIGINEAYAILASWLGLNPLPFQKQIVLKPTIKNPRLKGKKPGANHLNK